MDLWDIRVLEAFRDRWEFQDLREQWDQRALQAHRVRQGCQVRLVHRGQ